MEGRGKRNLIILGVGAMVITTVTTCLSLWIYRSSGDIYLDRSRPGYLPDEEEVDNDPTTNSNYVFSETGALTEKDLDEYLKELKKLDNRLKALSDPYASGPLSDESLGISEESSNSEKNNE